MVTKERFTVSGSQLVDKVKQLIHEGNIRRERLVTYPPARCPSGTMAGGPGPFPCKGRGNIDKRWALPISKIFPSSLITLSTLVR